MSFFGDGGKKGGMGEGRLSAKGELKLSPLVSEAVGNPFLVGKKCGSVQGSASGERRSVMSACEVYGWDLPGQVPRFPLLCSGHQPPPALSPS